MSPYAERPPRNFWKTGIPRTEIGNIRDLYHRKFEISASDRIATAGSCFAQHITARLRASGYDVMDMEPPPPWLPEGVLRDHGYGLFSARYGNIYTARQLLQLARESFGEATPARTVWDRKGRYYDSQRPAVDPRGLDSADEVLALRLEHLRQVRRMFANMDVFVFTLGLTEAWMSSDGSTVYPTAPGTIAGKFNASDYVFHNFTFDEIVSDLEAFRDLVGQSNPDFRMILTVSPVPLTATATDDHVLSASTYSKSVLRAVAGHMASKHESIEYFPSFELISSHVARGKFFNENLRTVNTEGVEAAMRMFLQQHPVLDKHRARAFDQTERIADPLDEETRCEDELLEAFAK
ncbi:MAG: GSCFA domain-containing protein [Pseudomonadota bacterium]